MLIFLCSVSKLKCFIKTLFANDMRDPFTLQQIDKWIVQCFLYMSLLPPFLFFCLVGVFFKHMVICLIIHVKYVNFISKASRETPCNSSTHC